MSRGAKLWALGLAWTLAAPACGSAMRTITGRRVTGTCAGACDHYTTCKAGASDADLTRCLAECPDVFSDADSLAAYESLDCPEAVSYVDGEPAERASR